MMLDCASGKGRTIKTILLMEAFDTDLVTRGKECGIDILSLKEFEVRITTSSSDLLLMSGVPNAFSFPPHFNHFKLIH